MRVESVFVKSPVDWFRIRLSVYNIISTKYIADMFRKAEIFHIFHQSLAAPAARNGQNVSAVLKLYKCLSHIGI